MNFVGLERAIMIASIGSKFCSGKEFPKSMAKKSKHGTSLKALRSGPLGSNIMTKCLTMNNGMSLRSSNGFGTSLSFMPKRHGNKSLNKLRLAASQPRPCFKASTKPRELGMCFVEGTICILSGIGKDKLGR